MASEVEKTDVAANAVGKYVYCIIQSEEPRSFGPIGIGGRGDRVYTVHYQDLAAVVSDTPLTVYDPTRDNVMAHEEVNTTVLSQFTVLPLAFGSLFRSEADIIEIMRRTYDTLRDTLLKMDGKVEFGLKVDWDRGRVMAEIEQENSEIRQLKEQASQETSNSAYFSQIELGRLVEVAIKERADNYLHDIYSMLRGSVAASQANKTIGDKMIMNAAFLIERAHEADFAQHMEAAAAKYEGTLSFKYSGPWPPYNFVQIRLKLGQEQSGN
jgi:hypothetical protein